MEFDFTDAMQQTTDDELIRIVTVDRYKYQEAALVAADNEFKKRDLPAEKFNQLKRSYENQEKLATKKAAIPLPATLKVLAFLSAGASSWFFTYEWSDNGFERKVTEFRKWGFFGLLFYLILMFIFMR